jgi:predicted DNA-binding WGR domain protein
MARFYTIAVMPNLFGEWRVVREWGRIGRDGALRETSFENKAGARQWAGLLQQAKRERGYQVTDSRNEA